MSYIALRNWRKFQHYDPSKRTPPWVKLHVQTLDDGDLAALPAAAQLVAYKLLMVAARTQNRIPDSPKILAGWVQLPTKTVTTSLKHLQRIGFLDFRFETESEIEMAQRGQLPLIPASTDASIFDDSASTHARPRARTETETEREEPPSNATPTQTTHANHAEPAALPGHALTALEKLLTETGAAGTPSENVMRALAARMSEHVHAQTLESFRGRTPRPDNPIGYAIACLRAIAADTGRPTTRITREPEL